MSSFTSTYTLSDTFTITHAKYIASKVATDLLRFRRFYGSPSLDSIDMYEEELAILLKYDAVDTVIYGFKRNNLWTMASAKYRAFPGGSIHINDDPGKIRPGLDVKGARFGSCLNYSSRWLNLSEQQRVQIKKAFRIVRTTTSSSGLETGSWVEDLKYMAGGRGLGRSTVGR